MGEHPFNFPTFGFEGCDGFVRTGRGAYSRACLPVDDGSEDRYSLSGEEVKRLVSVLLSTPLELVSMDFLKLERSKGGVENIMEITDDTEGNKPRRLKGLKQKAKWIDGPWALEKKRKKKGNDVEGVSCVPGPRELWEGTAGIYV